VDRVRVLIADDEQSMRESLADLVSIDPTLEFVGAASDAEEAIDLAERLRPDVAVLDVRMPEGGGARAAREIALRCPETSVVALSAHEDQASIIEMLKAGALGYVAKSASTGELKEAIRRSVEGRATLAASVAEDIVRELVNHLDQTTAEAATRGHQLERIQRVLARGAITVVFEPIVDIRSGDVVGVEALPRFSSRPRRGPEVWFAEAEAVGLLLPLEFAAVRAALERLPEIPRELFLSINASPEFAGSAAFVDMLEDVAVEQIVVEVTEQAHASSYAGLNDALLELRAAGLKLAIDDAGAGFASLRDVVRLSPDVIKMEASLARDVDTDLARQALVCALLSFASKIASSTVAEGVESETQMDTLRHLGVRYAQGSFLGSQGSLESVLARGPRRAVGSPGAL